MDPSLFLTIICSSTSLQGNMTLYNQQVKSCTEMSAKLYVTPDQGWVWVVLAGAFLSNAICSLYTLTGVFNVIFLEVFEESAAMTAWMVGIHSALVSLVGEFIFCNIL